ncbi:MAG: AraC family transcriptional regulator [Pedobacter sp.]|uniref:helix-turn-helix domain-containing protein n=1 Tax=Pedobacter sp. TaxID=1411316 RepID=UPI0035654455
MSIDSQTLNFILLNIGHAVHQADWNWKNISSPFARIHFVEEGTAKIIHGDKVYNLKKNHLYLTPSYTKHRYECDTYLSLYYIHIYEDLGKQLSIFDRIDFPVEIEVDSLTIQLIKRLVVINPQRELQYYNPTLYDNSSNLVKNIALQKTIPLAYEMETEGILKQIIAHFLMQSSSKNPDIDKRILNSLQHINHNINKPVNIEDLAKLCFLTKDHFIRLFKKSMNCTPGKYINQKKIEKAQLMIIVNDTSVKDVAYSLGFDNISYFNRLFKKITGETPGKHKADRSLSPSA